VVVIEYVARARIHTHTHKSIRLARKSDTFKKELRIPKKRKIYNRRVFRQKEILKKYIIIENDFCYLYGTLFVYTLRGNLRRYTLIYIFVA